MAVTPGQGRWPSLELEQLLEETHDAVVALDADLRFRFVNRRAARILGREPDELVGTELADAFPRAVGQPFLESWAEALERREPVSRSAFYEPLEGWFETRAVPAGQGLVVFARDITAGKQAEAELGRSERRHRVLTHQLGDMVWLVDPEGRPVKAADWAATIGQDVAPATDADWNEIVHPDDQAAVQAAWTTSLQTGRAFDHTMRMRSGDGRWLHIRSRAVPVRGAAGIEEWIGVNEDLTDQVEAEAALRRAASVDPLTGLPNRGQFVERLASAVARRAPRTAVLYVDLDRFKAINDHFGHAAGDALICAVAERLTATVRPSDVVSRLSGDEFAVICDELDSEEEAATIAARILEAIARPLEHDHRIQGSASIGVSFVGDHAAEDAEAVLRAADAAMYRAKARGGAAVEVFDERLREVLRRRSTVDAELRAGIDEGAVQLAFQPIVPLGADRSVSLEALLRWQRPGGPAIPAYEAVSVAEQNGLIGRIGREVLRLACAQAAAWCAEGRDLSVAVNLSPRQLARPEELLDDVGAALRDAGLAPERLVLEITENVLMEGSSEEVVDALRALGIALEIDDFGVGYSSLSYLHRLPVQAVKLDRSFVSGLPADLASARILDAVVGLGRAFDIGVIAEGVETPEQLEAVQAAGCDAVQGFCLARPAPPHEVPAALAEAARACQPSSPERSR